MQAVVGVRQTGSYKIRLRNLTHAGNRRFHGFADFEIRDEIVGQTQQQLQPVFFCVQFYLRALQLVVDARKLACSLSDPQLEIFARFYEQSLHASARDAKPTHGRAEDSVNDEIGL